MTGRLAEAVELLDDATALAHRLGARRLVAMTLGNATQVRLAGGDLEGASRLAVASTESALRIGDVAIALDCLQVPAVVAELQGEGARAAGWWNRHARSEERLGRPHDAAISWLRFAALAAAGGDTAAGRSAIDHADAVAGRLATDDLTLHRERAADACAGRYSPPPEAVTTTLPFAAPGRVAARGDAGASRRAVRPGRRCSRERPRRPVTRFSWRRGPRSARVRSAPRPC